MKVLFHTHTLNFRGTAVAVTDYAKYNQEILGNESVICYNSGIGYEKDMGTEQESLEYIKSQFEVRSCTMDQLDSVCNDINVAYFLRAGNRELLPTNVQTAVHAVFQHNDPHGDRYAYISEWMSSTMSEGTVPFVPHIVSLPEPTGDYREKLGISKDKTVIGRIGGYYTFDIPFVKKIIENIVNTRDDFIFLFCNTAPFIKHPNVRYIDSIVDRQKKANFINTCDGFLHARQQGESFGLALCETLYFNKPTLAYNGGHDKHHINLLKDTELLYDVIDIENKILDIKGFQGNYKQVVDKFEPEMVMEKFNKVFLQ